MERSFASMLTYKFRIYPARPQERLLSETPETCRHLYNDLLSDRIENGTDVWEIQNSLPKLKVENKFLQAHSQVLQDVNFRLGKAFRAFFGGNARRPKFRRRGHYNSLTYPQLGGFRIDGNNRIKLSKIGRMRIKLHRPMDGVIPKTCTIVRDIDQWYACISVEAPNVQKSPTLGRSSVGVDLGVTNLVALSDGTLIPNPGLLVQSSFKLKSLQRDLSRKQLSSKNRVKAKIRLKKVWRTLRRRRDDLAHKLSDRLTKENEVVVFEDLRIRSMVKNHSLASAIMDSTWGKLRLLAAYKAEMRGGRVILVNPSGTSQKCSGCGEIVPKDLSTRKHLCPRCGLVIDRDVNAARNILKLALEQARVEAGSLLIQRRG
jgi:putative transposase